MDEYKIILILLLYIVINFFIIFFKFYVRSEKFTWKLIAILQIPVWIISILIIVIPEILIGILIIAVVMCLFSGILFSYFGKKSATHPIDAEIIDIEFVQNNMLCKLTLRYFVNGVEYINKYDRLFHRGEMDVNMRVGDMIKIKYNPKNPNDICIP